MTFARRYALPLRTQIPGSLRSCPPHQHYARTSMPARRTTVRRMTAAAAADADADLVRQHRLLGGRPSRGWLARSVRRRRQQQLRRRCWRKCLRLDWTRSVKGSLAAQVALGSTGATNYLAANAQTAGGCSLMVWEADNQGRQRWCTRLWQGGGLSGPLFDGFDNLYVGQPGAMLSFPPTQWIRWRQPVIGVPLTPRILNPGQVLVVTHLGQVLVFDAQRGDVVGTSLDLVEGLDPTDSQRGLADCALGRQGCPVAAAPAFSPATDIVVVTLWEPNADAPEVVGLRYRPGQTPLLSRAWTSSDVGGGPHGQPGALGRRHAPRTSPAATKSCGRSTPTTARPSGRCR